MKLRPCTVRLLENCFAAFLLIYPKAFRDQFGREMKLAFLSAARDVFKRGGTPALMPFLGRVIADGLASSAREHFEMPQRLLVIAMVLVLVFVDWLTFHDVFEPHTVRDYLTLAASVLVFVHIGLDIHRRRIGTR